MNPVPGEPGIRIETSKMTNSSRPWPAATAPWSANGPIMPGGTSLRMVATNFSPMS